MSAAPGSVASSRASSVSSVEIEVSELPIEVSDEDRAAAAETKKLANAAFAKHDFPAAVELYTTAISQNPLDKTLWCNRALMRMKLEEYGYALHDNTRAISLDPAYSKAYYRRAQCYLQIVQPQQSIPDFKKVLQLEPKNETVRAQMVATQKLIRRIEFEKAIEREAEQSALERCREIIAEGGCAMDKAYTGPKLEEDDEGRYQITPTFVKEMIEWFKAGKSLPKRYVWEICLRAHEFFAAEGSLVDVAVEEDQTISVIGDVHGQFFDVLHLYSLTGEPSDKHLVLMNGDLVDRGSWSMEVILLALTYKWLYPHSMFINRGNHEAKDMNRTYGFEDEAVKKHGDQTYKLFADLFTTLPLSTLISATKPPPKKVKGDIVTKEGLKRYFVVHGGLFSKDDVTLDDIRGIDRFGRQPGQEGLICELLWTDPQTPVGRGPSKRGVGIAFGPDVTAKWCKSNKVTGIIRSHEVRMEGYEVEHNGLCTTVFSAPNYCDSQGNKGAFITIDAAGTQSFTQFGASPHPDLKPMAYLKGGLASMMGM